MNTNILKKNAMSQNQQRNSSIELCRILSMMMIVACHFATHGGFSFPKGEITIPRLWWNLIEMGGNFGVDVFVLISGYFMVSNERLTLNLFRTIKLVGQILFYSLGIYFISTIFGLNQLSIKSLVKAIFPITTGAWWFATTYFVLFIIHPYINRLILSLNKKQYQSLIILLLIIWCIIPTLTTYGFNSNELLQFILIYLIAGYIKIYGAAFKFNSKHYLIIWLIMTILIHFSSFALLLVGKKIDIFAEHPLLFYGSCSLLNLIRAISFFMIFEKMPIKHSKTINFISAATFGVYLIHDNNIIRPWLWKTLLKNYQYQDSLLLIPYSIAIALIVFTVCILIDIVRINTIECLFLSFVNRHLTAIEMRFHNFVRLLKIVIFGKRYNE